jgi:cytochrome c2
MRCRLKAPPRIVLLAALLVPAFAALAVEPAWQVPGGDASRAPALLHAFGCAACHTIPGIADANGNVGPPLIGIGGRTFIAGMLRNEPANLIRWIRFPQSIVPGNAMPDMGVSEQEARDIAAYLYTLH